MKRLYILLAFIVLAKLTDAQIIFNENFSAGMPAGFTLYNDANTPHANIAGLFPTAWSVIKEPADTFNYVAGSPSWFTAVAPADRWMVTTGIAITTNCKLSWKGKAQDPDWLDGYVVKISTAGVNKTDFTTTLLTVAHETSTWTTHEIDLNAYAGQTVYIAFIQNSTDMFYIMIDDIRVNHMYPNDAGVTAIFAPVTGCSLSSAEQVKVKIKNYGVNSISNVPVHYKFNNGATVDGTCTGPIASGAIVDFTFPTVLNASAFGVDSIVAWTSFTGDGDATNDYAPTYYLANIQPATAPYSNSFETQSDLMGMIIIDANQDGSSWNLGSSATSAHTGSQFIYYSYNADSVANDWAFSKCTDLNPGTYNVGFWYKIADATYPERLEAKYGTSQDIAGMTNTIVTLNMTDTNYAQSVTPVVITTAGTYYFGLHAISDPDMYYILIDDFTITTGGIGVQDNNQAIFNIYPNPTKGILNIESTDNIEELSMMNAIGQAVYNSAVNDINFTINTSNMNTGVYFLKLKTANGYTVRKVVVE